MGRFLSYSRHRVCLSCCGHTASIRTSERMSSKAVFCEYPLNRAGHVRDRPELEAELQNQDSATLVLLKDGAVLCRDHAGAAPTVQRLAPLRDHRELVQQPIIFLGLSTDGAPHFAASIGKTQLPGADVTWVDLRKNSTQLEPADAALAGTAHGLLAWHRSCEYNEESGGPLVPGHAGWARVDESSKKCVPVHVCSPACTGQLDHVECTTFRISMSSSSDFAHVAASCMQWSPAKERKRKEKKARTWLHDVQADLPAARSCSDLSS
jgi:NADH pyrophosphatase-like rudimentary NUDIX domain